MKKAVFFLAALSICAIPAFAQLRLDIGADIPRGLGGLAEGGAVISKEAGQALDQYVFPFPEAGLYYQGSVGPMRIGAGVRLFTFILESVFWPNAFVELDAGHFVVACQLGGGAFGLFGLFSSMQTGAVLIPDVSAWFKIGSSFRIGGGAIGFMLPNVSNSIIFAYYLGAKFAVVF